MPIPHHAALTSQWVSREEENQLIEALNLKKARILPFVGAGGAGKSSVLRRFISHAEKQKIPAILIDLPRMTNVANVLDVLLQLSAKNTPTFENLRLQLKDSYESLYNQLQPYGETLASTAALLKKSNGDESYGVALDAAVGAGKLIAQFWSKEESKVRKTLLQTPEESLLKALREDFNNQGLILIDTLEQALYTTLKTHLLFKEDGDIATQDFNNESNVSFLGLCGNLAHYFLDKNILMVMAGRPPALRNLGNLPAAYFLPTLELAPFTTKETTQYLDNNMPHGIAKASSKDIATIQKLTHGNPFLIERLVHLLADWSPKWNWQADQWQPLEHSFLQDDRHGLLLYITQRLLTHTLPHDQDFWRLAIPRQGIHRDFADLLYPETEFNTADNPSGLNRLVIYEEKGIIYRTIEDPDIYLMHDETRLAFVQWAIHKQVWLVKQAATIHHRIGLHIQEKNNWQAVKKLLLADQKNYVYAEKSIYDNPQFLEATYHAVMAIGDFEEKYAPYQRLQFFDALAASFSLNNAEKLRVGSNDSSIEQVKGLIEIFNDENEQFEKVFSIEAFAWIREKCIQGESLSNLINKPTFIREALQRFPYELQFLIISALHSSLEEAEQFISTAVKNKGSAELYALYAWFKDNKNKTPDEAEALYKEAINLGLRNINFILNFAWFMYKSRNNAVKAEALMQKAHEIEPENFEVHLSLCRLKHKQEDLIAAEHYIRQAKALAPKNEEVLLTFARIMSHHGDNLQEAFDAYVELVKLEPNVAYTLEHISFVTHKMKDLDFAESLYVGLLDVFPDSTEVILSFAIFLHVHRKNFELAKRMYVYALELLPNDANLMANLAQVLLIDGNNKIEAKEWINKAFALKPTAPALLLELWFYCYAHYWTAHSEAEAEIEKLYQSGARTGDWDFSGNIALAKAENHPNLRKLKKLAKQLAKSST